MGTPIRPNILFYCTDEQRADLMGCMGHPKIRTPHMDALARRGVLFQNLYVQGTVCMPSRASILTGRYPFAHGVTDNGYNLPASERTIADMLSAEEYFTAAVGRTHIRCSLPHPVLPKSGYYGFQECHHSQCYWTGLDPHGAYLEWIRQAHPDRYVEAATPYVEAATPQPVSRDDAYCSSWTTLEDDKTMTAWVTNVSLEVIRNHQKRNDGRPFFLWAGTWDPHPRFLVPAPWDRMYSPSEIPLPVCREGELDDLPPHFSRVAMQKWPNPKVPMNDMLRNTLSIYWGTISHIDDQFGRLMRGLEEMDILENTIVVFTSDHGEMAGDHWVWHKGPYFYDAALRVPGIIAAPGRLPAGRSIAALVETVDLTPTLLDMAGARIPLEVQGRTCLSLLRGETETHRPDAYTEYHDYNVSRERMFSIRTGRYRITCYQDKPYGELFDLKEDPQALYNKWNDPKYVMVKQELQMRLLHRMMGNLTRPDTREASW